MRPTLGQIVLYRDCEGFERPAIVTHVYSAEHVNLQVFLDGLRDAGSLAAGSRMRTEVYVPREDLRHAVSHIVDCWRFCHQRHDWGISCDCCGASPMESDHGYYFPCDCHHKQYCSTCMYCEKHCLCGYDQDLQPDFAAAILARLDRLAAQERLPDKYPGRTH